MNDKQDLEVKTAAEADFETLIREGVDNQQLCMWARTSVLYNSMKLGGIDKWCCVRFKNAYIDNKETALIADTPFDTSNIIFVVLASLRDRDVEIEDEDNEGGVSPIVTRDENARKLAPNLKMPKVEVKVEVKKTAGAPILPTEPEVAPYKYTWNVKTEQAAWAAQLTPYARLLGRKITTQNSRPFSLYDPQAAAEQVLTLPSADFVKKMGVFKAAIGV
jgi:hypothetical protein